MMTTLSIARRFCGPPESANGGYFSGMAAGLAGCSCTVRLLKPPPLEQPLELQRGDQEPMRIVGRGEVIAELRRTELSLFPPAPPTHLEAVEASRHCPGFLKHPFPTCFVCGPLRARGDGLRIFPGPIHDDDLVAAPWIPDASLEGIDGKVRPEFMWAALDCPGFFAANSDMRPMLLGELNAHVDRLVHIDEPCTVIGWRIGGAGRKHEVGTALFDEDGELCARARAIWIELRP